jgi:multidrug efflux pump subunit AcrB
MQEGVAGLAALLSRIRIAILLVCALVAWGLLSLYNIRKESWPDVEVPMGLVTVIYPGAPAYLVEGEVTNILEAELKGLPSPNLLFPFSRVRGLPLSKPGGASTNV